MKPDRFNYEIWFTDLIDGQLDDQQVKELDLFLKENPDLKVELEAMSVVNIKPHTEVFQLKESIRKSIGDYSQEQFEQLCIAFHENDLSEDQVSELKESVNNDLHKMAIMQMTGKLKLIPPEVVYSHKSRLKRLSAGQKILRLTALGMSAAASVAILVLLLIPNPAGQDEAGLVIPQRSSDDTLFIRRPAPVIAHGIITAESVRMLSSRSNLPEKESQVPEAREDDQKIYENPGSIFLYSEFDALPSVPVQFPEGLIRENPYAGNSLRGFKTKTLPFFDDGRSNVERFMARFFHEKIMKDPDSGDSPVGSFELAEAGITGLNKLFGWELALNKNPDDNGDPKSYYFSSKLLKFNAPVKKNSREL